MWSRAQSKGHCPLRANIFNWDKMNSKQKLIYIYWKRRKEKKKTKKIMVYNNKNRKPNGNPAKGDHFGWILNKMYFDKKTVLFFSPSKIIRVLELWSLPCLMYGVTLFNVWKLFGFFFGTCLFYSITSMFYLFCVNKTIDYTSYKYVEKKNAW